MAIGWVAVAGGVILFALHGWMMGIDRDATSFHGRSGSVSTAESR